MSLTVAIHPDDYTNPQTPEMCDASSPVWAELLNKAGHQVRWVDVYRADILEQLRGCDGFMWRWAHFGGMHRVARRLLPVLERELGLVVYPNQDTCWHYDDKIAQRFLLEAAGVRMPKTWIWFEPEGARNWARSAQYPLVMKLATGAGSENVRMIHCHEEAETWIRRMFTTGMHDLSEFPADGPRWNWARRLKATAKAIIKGEPLHDRLTGLDSLPNRERQKGYILFQEFLSGNEFDTRVTVIGNRAFAFRRHNRSGDFRASGSGRIDWNPTSVDPQMIRLAFDVAVRLRTQSVAIDGLLRGDQPVVGEVSYTYVSWAVEKCPGYWWLDGEPWQGRLHWQEGHMRPEEAQVADYLQRLEQRWPAACELPS